MYAQASAVTQCLINALPKQIMTSSVMVVIHLQVALSLDGKIKQPMPSESVSILI